MIRMSLIATGAAVLLGASVPTPAAAAAELPARFLIEHTLDNTCLVAIGGAQPPTAWLADCNLDPPGDPHVWHPRAREDGVSLENDSGGCLDVDANHQVVDVPCTSSGTQEWGVDKSTGRIINMVFLECLDGNVQADPPVYLNDCNETQFQHWRIQGVARSAASHLVPDHPPAGPRQAASRLTATRARRG